MTVDASEPAGELRLIELLCSRLCHDLAGPIGAIRNGLELVEEMAEPGSDDEGGFGAEAIGLIRHSADQAGRRLQFFRLAYGMAGAETPRGFEDARKAAREWLEGGRISLVWPTDRPAAATAQRRGAAKLVLNLIMIAEEALVQGGTITVDGSGTAAAGHLSVTAAGPLVRPAPDSLTALAPGEAPGTVTARSVHAAITARFAEAYRLRLEITPPAANDPRLLLALAW